ncbi:formate dehydrogenase subunit alpha [Halobacteriales archaeon QS_4_69_34]|nr:MAG: formate dehydrogenase subunit alpha [Halobacteriales archaeon QS_4_69_34]
MSEHTRFAADAGSVCPFCAVGCRVRYDADSGRARGVTGAAVNRRGELCSKGVAAFDGLDEDRLTEPLVRRDGTLEPASWTEAYDRIEAGFGGVLDDHGPDALAFLGAPHCTNEENYLFQLLARALGTNNVDNRARLCHDATAAAMEARLGSAGTTTTLADLAAADAFLVIGSNPAARQPVAFDSYVRPAVDDGATLIHVDPHANETTRLADHHLAPRPGADALVVALLIDTVLRAGLIDERFVHERTTGFAAFAASMADFDAGQAAERAGVDLGEVREAARTFGRVDRAAVIAGTGVEPADGGATRSGQGTGGKETIGTDGETATAEAGTTPTTAADALLDLLLLTGNFGKHGVGMNLFRGLNNEQGASDAGALPHRLPGGQPVTKPEARARAAAVWDVEPPAEPGRNELDLVQGFGDAVRGAYVLGENPAVTKLDDQSVARGLDSLEFLLVQDIAPTATTEHADVVLPASAWAEKGGTVTNLDRQVQRTTPLRSPPGNARRDLAVLRELGRRLTDRAFDYEGPAEVFAELTRVSPDYAGMSYEGVGRGGQRWPFPAGAEEGVEVLHRERFANDDRRAPFGSAVDPGRFDGDGRGTGSALDGDAPGVDDRLALLTGSRRGEFTSGTTGPTGARGAVDGGLGVHPADADARAVADGERVVVESCNARVRATATHTESVRRGTVHLHASVAEPLVGEGRTRVRLVPARDREEGEQ